jgi:hypothetical protein
MPLFPDIGSKGFEKIEFFGHVADGFAQIKEYWESKGKCCVEDNLWFYSKFERKGRSHTILLEIKPADRRCANFRILLQSTSPDALRISEVPRHKMTGKHFLGMFERLFEAKKELLPVSFRFTQVVATRALLFPDAQENAPFSLTGIKLRGAKDGPIQSIIVEDKTATSTSIEVESRPVYRIMKESLNVDFFKKPLTDMMRMGKTIIKRTEETGYAKRLTS